MMSTRRSLTLTACGVAMLAFAGSAAAQAPDTTAAVEVPANDLRGRDYACPRIR